MISGSKMYSPSTTKSPSLDALCSYHHRPAYTATPQQSASPLLTGGHMSVAGTPHATVDNEENSVLLVLPDGFCLLSDSDCSSGEVATYLWLKNNYEAESESPVSDARKRTRSSSVEELQKHEAGFWNGHPPKYASSYDGSSEMRQGSPKHVLESFKQLGFEDGDYFSQDATPSVSHEESPKHGQELNYKHAELNYQDGDSIVSHDGSSQINQQRNDELRKKLIGPKIGQEFYKQLDYVQDVDSISQHSSHEGHEQMGDGYSRKFNYQDGDSFFHDGVVKDQNHKNNVQESLKLQLKYQDGDSFSHESTSSHGNRESPRNKEENHRHRPEESFKDLTFNNRVQNGSTHISKECLKHGEKIMNLYSFGQHDDFQISHETLKQRKKSSKDSQSSSEEGNPKNIQESHKHRHEGLMHSNPGHDGITGCAKIIQEGLKHRPKSQDEQAMSQNDGSPQNGHKSSKYSNSQDGNPRIRHESLRYPNSEDGSSKNKHHEGSFSYLNSQDGTPAIRHEGYKHTNSFQDCGLKIRHENSKAQDGSTRKTAEKSRHRRIGCSCMAYSRAYNAANSESETDSYSLKSWQLHPIEVGGKENEGSSHGASPSCSRGCGHMGKGSFIQEYHQWSCRHHRVALRSGISEMNGCGCCNCCCHGRWYSNSCCVESSGSLCYARGCDKTEKVVVSRLVQRHH
eukprot:Gb_03013 [translate_table: standard]